MGGLKKMAVMVKVDGQDLIATIQVNPASVEISAKFTWTYVIFSHHPISYNHF